MTEKDNAKVELNYIKYIKKIGLALSKEKNKDKLLYIILDSAKSIANADGGSIYLIKDNLTDFYIFLNDSLGINLDHENIASAGLGKINLYDKDGKPNLSSSITCSIHENKIINIKNAYTTRKYDLSSTYEFDKKMNYKSISILTIPLKNHQQKIIGGFQLINAKDKLNKIIPFSKAIIDICETIAALGGIILTQKLLIDAQKKLFDSLIKLIAIAIDDKSAYTSAHCRRVPILTQMLADAVNDSEEGLFKDLYINENQMYELNVAAWLHDCGKLTTPEYILDKSTKLETIVDRIELIKLRFEIIKRDLTIKYKNASETFQKHLNQLLEDFEFLVKMNDGVEFHSPDELEKLKEIFNRYQWIDHLNEKNGILTEKEFENLSIVKGTLNKEEREIVNQHVSVTYKMLASLPFPDHISSVPDIAANHHEKIDGTGYPRHLKGDQLNIQTKILTIADIFEALTSTDRPYKKAKKLSEAIAILEKMKKSGEIDSNLFDLFMRKKIYLEYAKRYLPLEQIDYE